MKPDTYLNRHFKWPSRKFFYWYATVTGALTVLALLGTAFNFDSAVSYNTGERLAMAALVSAITIIHGALLYVMIGLYYRLFLNAQESWRQFRAWSPGAVSRFKARCQAVRTALSRAVDWCARLPSRLRWPTGEELAFTAFAASALAIIALIGWWFWPLATRLSLAMPHWLPGAADSGSDFMAVVFIDLIISCIPISIALALWSSVVTAIFKRFKRP